LIMIQIFRFTVGLFILFWLVGWPLLYTDNMFSKFKYRKEFSTIGAMLICMPLVVAFVAVMMFLFYEALDLMGIIN
jgi:hypothetical protein